jgi:hypothetical protein
MSKVDQNIEEFVKYIIENNINLNPSPEYFGKKSGRYVNKQLTEEYQNLENMIFDVLLENNKDANGENLITKKDLEEELVILVEEVKTIGLANIDINTKIREWKNEITSKSQNTITYFLPVFNLNIATSKEKITSEINVYSSKEVLTHIKNKRNQNYSQIKKYLIQPDSAVLGIEVKGYGNGNEISLSKAIALGQLFVSLVNFLVDIDKPKCVLVRDISYVEEKYNTFSGWQAVKEVNSFIMDENNPNINESFLMPSNVKNFSFIFDPQKNRERQIRNAIRWLGESIVDDNINNAYVKVMIALESIAEVKPDPLLSPSITDQISTMTALITEENSEKRIDVRERLKKAYRNRSNLVHGTEKNIDYRDYVFVANKVKKMIQELSLNSEYTRYSNIEELWKDLTNRMLSADIRPFKDC